VTRTAEPPPLSALEDRRARAYDEICANTRLRPIRLDQGRTAVTESATETEFIAALMSRGREL
jgi:hypothetical protein